MDCTSVFTNALAAIGVYALVAHVGLPIYDLLTRLRLHASPNWARLGAKKDGWALITGASTGMGREYALQLARKGMNVIIIADPPTAKELEEVRAQIIAESKGARQVIDISCNLLDDEVYEGTIFPQIEAVAPNVSVLINNVGMCVLNRYDHASIDTDLKMSKLNVIPMIRMTKYILPHMKRAKRGAILSMSSLSGDIPTPFLAVYGATKSFVRSFNAAIREEVRKYGITVTVPMPFGVKTPLSDKIGEQANDKSRHPLTVDPDAAVAAIIRKLVTGRELYGHDLHEALGTLMSLMSKEKSSAEFRKALIRCVTAD